MRRLNQFGSVLVLILLALAPARSVAQNDGSATTALLQRAIEAYSFSDHDKSLKLLGQAKQTQPSAAHGALIQLYMGLNYYAQGKPDLARGAFALACQLDPNTELLRQKDTPGLKTLFKVSCKPSSTATPVTPAPTTGTVRITIYADYRNAQAWLDGKLLGDIPYSGVVPAGEHLLVVRTRDGSRGYSRRHLFSGRRRSLIVPLRKLAAGSKPPGPGTPPVVPTKGTKPARTQSRGAGVLRPGTRRFVFALAAGGNIAMSNADTGGGLSELFGFHFRGNASGPALGVYFNQSFAGVSITDGNVTTTGSLVMLEAGTKFWWDIQLGSRGIYIAPWVRGGFFAGLPSIEQNDADTVLGGAIGVGVEAKVMIADRLVITLQPIGITTHMFSTDDFISYCAFGNGGGDLQDINGDSFRLCDAQDGGFSARVTFDLSISVGVTF